MTTSMRRTLTQPRWIAAVVVALTFAALFVRLGVWQLNRLDERRALNAVIEERRDSAPRPFDALVAEYGIDPEALKYRPTIVTGTYVPDAEVFAIGRTDGEVHGTLVATPLELADGSWLIVERGLVPPDTEGPPAVPYPPPAGTVEVFGYLDDGEQPVAIGEPDPEGGTVTRVARIDLAYLDKWMGPDVLPVSLVLADNGAGTATPPVPLSREELTEGPHLGYAVQWFAFAVIAVIGVAVLILRASRTVDEETVSETDAA